MINTAKHNFRIFSLLALLGLFASVQAAEYSHPEVEQLLQADVAPDGVVFELISGDKKTWQWAAPMISSLRAQLKAKFPTMDVAIVSHGAEQFQLTRQRQHEQPQAIAQLAGLVEDGVSLHVCGTHSEWKDVADTAYIGIVDVAASGPAQINDYIQLGYRHIILKKPL